MILQIIYYNSDKVNLLCGIFTFYELLYDCLSDYLKIS